MTLQKSCSEFLRRGKGQPGWLLGDLIQLHRGETLLGSRPNKSLIVPEDDFPHKDKWAEVVAHGVTPKWKQPLPIQTEPPKNHQSWTIAYDLLIVDVAKGQIKGENMILDGDWLPQLMASGQVFVSLFGGAEKEGKALTECA